MDDRFEPENNLRPTNPKPVTFLRKGPWRSRQAPGTPASFEAIFILIKNEQTHSAAFKYARDNLRNELTDEQLWEAYEAWTQGKVHEIILKWREGNESRI